MMFIIYCATEPLDNVILFYNAMLVTESEIHGHYPGNSNNPSKRDNRNNVIYK